MEDMRLLIIDELMTFIKLRWLGDYKPCPISTRTAQIVWDLWQAHGFGASLPELEALVLLICNHLGIPSREALQFIFEEDCLYGPLSA